VVSFLSFSFSFFSSVVSFLSDLILLPFAMKRKRPNERIIHKEEDEDPELILVESDTENDKSPNNKRAKVADPTISDQEIAKNLQILEDEEVARYISSNPSPIPLGRTRSQNNRGIPNPNPNQQRESQGVLGWISSIIPSIFSPETPRELRSRLGWNLRHREIHESDSDFGSEENFLGDRRSRRTERAGNSGRSRERVRLREREEREPSYEELLDLCEKIGSVKKDGLSSPAIASTTSLIPFTKSTSSSSLTSPQCTICLTDLQEGEKVRTLPCFHMFHGSCIDPWLRSNSSCPVCKTPISNPSHLSD